MYAVTILIHVAV